MSRRYAPCASIPSRYSSLSDASLGSKLGRLPEIGERIPLCAGRDFARIFMKDLDGNLISFVTFG